MAIITHHGPNSATIQYLASDTLASIRGMLEDYILAHGWTLHDSVGPNAAVFKAPNADGVTQKYLMIDWANDHATSPYAVLMKVYENWNADTNIGTNLAYLSDSAGYAPRIQRGTSGVIHVFCTARYLVLFTRIISQGNSGNSETNLGSSSYNAPVGIMEISRDNPEDTPELGYPTYAWVNFGLLSGAFSAGSSNSNQHSFSLPRLLASFTAANASQFNVLSTLFGRTVNETSIQGTSTPGNLYGMGVDRQMPPRLDPASFKPYALTCYAGNFNSNTFLGIKGRFYGLKLVGPYTALAGFEQIDIPVDADGFYQEGGVLKRHMVLRSYNSAVGTYSYWALPL